MMARACALFFLFAFGSHIRGQDVIRWAEGAPFAATEDANGQHYKTIELKRRIYVRVSFRHDRYSTLANVAILNESKQPFDVNPRQFTCTCSNEKPKTLKYSWPHGALTGTNALVLRSTTLSLAEDVKGVVSFERRKRCDPAVIRLPLAGSTFEFPFP